MEIYGPYEFVAGNTAVALPVIILLLIASVIGTFGNLLILTVVLMKRSWRHVEIIFIGNLAIADMYVTAVADPMSLIGR